MSSVVSAVDALKIEQELTENELDEVFGAFEVETPSRFKELSADDVDRFLSEQENDNTKKKTTADLRLFRTFCMSKNEIRDLENIPPEQLNDLFGNFLLSVRKKDGSEYEPTTLRGFFSSLDRYLRMKNYSTSLCQDPRFAKCRMLLKAKQKNLKALGKGNKPQAADEMTDDDIDKLFECGQLGIHNPLSITNFLHLIFSLCFGMRGGKEQRDLRYGDIEIHTDEDGEEYIVHKKERQTKTRPGQNPKDTRKFNTKAWAQEDSKRCPVTALRVYQSHRPPTMADPDSPFFLSINVKNPLPGQEWFKSMPMGVNHIYSLTTKMKLACDSIDNSRQLSNHSVRKHLVQRLNDANVPANQIIQISGHKNVNSVNNYSKINDQQQKQISRLLLENRPIQPSTLSLPPPNPAPSTSTAPTPSEHTWQ